MEEPPIPLPLTVAVGLEVAGAKIACWVSQQSPNAIARQKTSKKLNPETHKWHAGGLFSLPICMTTIPEQKWIDDLVLFCRPSTKSVMWYVVLDADARRGRGRGNSEVGKKGRITVRPDHTLNTTERRLISTR